MTLLGYSVPETLTNDAGKPQKGKTLAVTGPNAYTGVVVSDPIDGVFRLGPLPAGVYTVTYGDRSVDLPVFPTPTDLQAGYDAAVGAAPSTSLTAETAARAAADSAEASRASAAEAAEIALRATGDSNEASTRAAADAAATAAQAAATALEAADHAAEQTAIGNEATARGAAVTAEQARATAAEAALTANLASETATRTSADAARLLPRGAWVTATAYAVNDEVTANGVAWRCVLAHTAGATFSADPTKWERFGVGQVVSTAPSSPATDDLYYDKAADLWKRWNGSAWVANGSTTYLQPRATVLTSVGDSVIAQDSENNGGAIQPYYLLGSNGKGILSYANVKLGHPLKIVYNGGVSGERSDQFAVRVPTALAAGGPGSWAFIGPPTNDLAQGASLATIQGRMTAIFDAFKAGGVTSLVVMTALPQNALSAGNQTTRRAYNVWLQQYAATRPGMVFFDPNRYVEDPTTGQWNALYSTDGTHPNVAGAAQIGRQLALLLGPLVPVAPRLWTHTGDDSNLLANGIPTGSGGAKDASYVSGTVATSWQVRNTSGSLVSRSVSDGVTTSGSTSITSATAAFVSGDVGRLITGTGIPANTTIISQTGTAAVLSQAATATATGVTLTIPAVAAVASVVPRTDGVQGNVQRVVVSGGRGAYNFVQSVLSSGIPVGTIVYGEIECDIPGDWVGAKVLTATLEFYNGGSGTGTVYAIRTVSSDVYLQTSPNGTYKFRTPAIAVPAATNGVYLRLSFELASGTIDLVGGAIRVAAAAGVV